MKTITESPKLFPPSILLVGLLLIPALHWLFPITIIIPVYLSLSGILLIAFGVYISYSAEKQFHDEGTTVRPFDQSHKLITTKWYRYSRNPMYLGMVSVLVGVALLLGSLSVFLIPLIFGVWIDTQFIRREEEMLAAQFGQDWLEYKARVRRWI